MARSDLVPAAAWYIKYRIFAGVAGVVLALTVFIFSMIQFGGIQGNLNRFLPTPVPPTHLVCQNGVCTQQP
jgi:hypothetical protein